MSMDELIECIFPDEGLPCLSLSELMRVSGLAREEIIALVDFGILAPEGTEDMWLFSMGSLLIARTGERLKRGFELSPTGLALALTYLRRIESLESQLQTLGCQLLE